jgi:hypothetical protein
LTGFNAAGERRPLRRSLVPANKIYDEAGELTVAQLMAKIYKVSPPRFAIDADLPPQEEAHMFQRELERWCGMHGMRSAAAVRGCLCKRARTASSHCARVRGACVARLVAVADSHEHSPPSIDDDDDWHVMSGVKSLPYGPPSDDDIELQSAVQSFGHFLHGVCPESVPSGVPSTTDQTAGAFCRRARGGVFFRLATKMR